MDDAKAELVRDWLIKAQHDLGSAEKLASDPDPYLDTAIFHCQQAAEKAVKAFLVFHDQRFKKTHDIVKLIEAAAPFEAEVSSLIKEGAFLTPYATQFRYPDEDIGLDRDVFDRALAAAAKIFNFILSLLPEQVHPLKKQRVPGL